MAEGEVQYSEWFEAENPSGLGVKYRLCWNGEAFWLQDNLHLLDLRFPPGFISEDRPIEGVTKVICDG